MRTVEREYKFKNGATVKCGRICADVANHGEDAQYVMTWGFEVWFRGELLRSTVSWDKAAEIAKAAK